MRNVLLWVAVLAVPAYASAQSLQLQDAVNEAKHDSPVIQKADSQVELAAWKRVESYTGFLPTLSADATALADKKYMLMNINFGGNPAVVPQIIPNSQLALTATLPLFDGFASTNTYRSAKSEENAAISERNWANFKMERAVALQYYKAIASVTLKDVAEQNVKMLEDHLKDVRLLRKAGVATKYDELQVEVRVSAAKSELLNAIDNIEISKRELAEILGHENEERSISGTLPVLNLDLVTKLDEENFSRRQDIMALELKAQSLDFRESAASRYLVPKVNLFGQYTFYNNITNNITNTDDYRNAYQVGVSLHWNLFDGMGSIARSKQSVQENYQIQRTLRQARLKATKDLDLWRRKFIYFCNVYQSRLSDVEKATESVRLAKEAIRVGSKTNTDLLDAESELFQARAGVVNSQIGSIESLINLELASGKKIADFN